MADSNRVFRSDPPRFILAAAMLVAGFALWQLAAGVRGGADEDAVDTTSTTAVEAAALDSLDEGWVRIDLPGRAELSTVDAIDGTLFAAGWNPVDETTEVWRSDNGREWQRIPDPDGTFLNATVNGFAMIDDTVVAVGGRAVGPGPDGQALPSVWRSPDGISFARLPQEQISTWGDGGLDPDAAGGVMTDLRAVEGGLVSVGWHGEGTLWAPGATSRGGIWLSEAGKAWSPAFAEATELGGAGTMVASIDIDPAGLVAVGESAGVAVIWRSSDGTVWNRVSDPGGGLFDEDGIEKARLVATSDGKVVAFGAVSEDETGLGSRLRVWGMEGETWNLLDTLGLEEVAVSALAPMPPGFVAAGVVPVAEDKEAAGLWTSIDGSDWSRVTIESVPINASDMTGVAVHPDGLVAIGSVFEQPAVWFRPRSAAPDEEIAAGGPLPPPAWATVFQEQEPSNLAPTRVERANGTLFGLSSDRVLWLSGDGRTWAPIPFDEAGLADAENLHRLASVDDLVVAIGEGEVGELWLTSDGVTWGRPSKAPPCCVRAVFPLGAREFVALGRDPADADSWFAASSADGLTWEVVAEVPDLVPADIWEHAYIDGVMIAWGGQDDGAPTGDVWISLDGLNWVPSQGSNLGVDPWHGVWRLADRVIAAGRAVDGLVVFQTDGVEWRELGIPDVEHASARAVDAGSIADGVALLIDDGDRQRLFVVREDGGAPEEIPLTVAAGFGGLDATLGSNGAELRALGLDHGRMTVWEWVAGEE